MGWLANKYVGLDGRVAPRSGLANKHGIDTMAGVIDADYRGPVGVILANLSDTNFEIKVGDRIAQLIVEKVRQGYSL
jgi:dUTP pyrophosphatase